MGCEFITDDNNWVIGFFCSRNQPKKCSSCGKPAEVFCDYPLKGHKAGETCNRPLCLGCASEVEKIAHYCGPHNRLAQAKKEDEEDV